MSRAPFVFAKADAAFSRSMKLEDTTIGWRFVNPLMKAKYGTDSMPETGEIVAEEFRISREDQDAFALRSQQRAADAIRSCRMAQEIVPVPLPQKKGEPTPLGTTTSLGKTASFSVDEHPRPDTTLEALSKLKGIVKPGGTVTAGNASGVNDGACALLLASEAGARRHGLTPKARVVAAAATGVAPRIMGMGPAPATRKVLAKANLPLDQISVIELNEAFASQALAVLRALGIADDAPHVNPNGGAIALGHPLGASGARLVTTAMYQLLRTKTRYALCTMCIGVGQGIAVILERV
jgi:acetyl-CoA acetyltransferase family protein